MIGDRPGDAQLTWYLDDHQCLEPVGPLTQSLYPYVFRGFAKVQRDRGRQKPALLRTLFVKGYLYVHFQPPGSALSEAGKQSARLSPLQWEREWLPEIRANLDRLSAYDLASLADDELASVLHEALQILSRHWEIHHSLSFNAVNQLTKWYRQRFPQAPEQEAAKLIQGFPNRSTEVAQALWELSRSAPEQFETNLARFLGEYGHSLAKYCDVGSPTWVEDPSPVLELMKHYQKEGTHPPLGTGKSLAAEREALITAVHKQLSPEERAEFEEKLAVAQAENRAGENHAFWIEGRTMAAVRRICIEFGRRMALAGILPDPADASLVTVTELLHYGFGSTQPHLREVLPMRRSEYLANQEQSPGPWLGAPPDEEEETDEGGEADPSVLKGTGVSAGVMRGTARVVRTLEEALALRKGEVLVCKETDPRWTPIVALASGVVLDSFAGGMLAHAAVVAREFRLPAVVGVGGALDRIKTGQMIEVNGIQGVVRLL